MQETRPETPRIPINMLADITAQDLANMEYQVIEPTRSPAAEPDLPDDMMLSEQSEVLEMDDIPMDMATPISSPVRDTFQSHPVSGTTPQDAWTASFRETTPPRPSTATPEPPTPPLPPPAQTIPTTQSSPHPHRVDTESTSTAFHQPTPESVATRQPSPESAPVEVAQDVFKTPDLPIHQPTTSSLKRTYVQPQPIQAPKRTRHNPNGVFARDQVMPWAFHALNAEKHRMAVMNIEVCLPYLDRP